MEENKLQSTVLNTFIIWGICVVGFVSALFLSTHGFTQAIDKINFSNNPLLPPFLVGFFFTGVSAFCIGSCLLTFSFVRKLQTNIFGKIIAFIGIGIMLPLYAIYTLSKRQLVVQTLPPIPAQSSVSKKLVVVIIILIPVWLISFGATGALAWQVATYSLGYSPITEYVAGTGSMYPTFPKSDKKTDLERFKQTVASAQFIPYPNGIALLGKRYFNHDLQRGDIISFKNKTTEDITKHQYGEATGFIKRVIALPGDTLQLRGGIVYLNGKPLKEPYTAKPRSTFGEEFLGECKEITIPPHKVFAMGDNRKGSGDSREIGFVDVADIDHVLTLAAQKGVWDKYWRNTAHDFDESAKIKLDRDEYMKLLNQKRQEAGVQLVKYQPKLEQSAVLRGKVMLAYDDFSWEATRSGYTMSKAMADAGYSNITYGEAPTQGYFEADELLDNQFQFPNSKDFLLHKDYQEIGIAEVEGNINGCPTQVIVQHLAGYIPPNYSSEVIASWEKALTNLKSIQGGWSNLSNSGPFYDQHKADVDRINQIIAERINQISSIVTKMQANQWLTPDQDAYTKTTDQALAKEQDALATKLNSSQ